MIQTRKSEFGGPDMVIQNHALFDYVYNSVKKRLHNEVEKVMKIKKSMKMQSVLDTIIKRERKDKDPQPKYDDNSWIKIDEKGQPWEYKPFVTSTKVIAIAPSNFTQTLDTQQDKLKKLFIQESNNLGSEWRIDRFTRFIVTCYTVKPLRASSYIPTPAPYNNPKCGLINIQNNDNKCFQWCLKYHQGNKSKNDDRISSLTKVDDKYSYDNVNFPASLDDITTFEDNNKVCVNVYKIEKDNSITAAHLGNIDYIKNDTIY